MNLMQRILPEHIKPKEKEAAPRMMSSKQWKKTLVSAVLALLAAMIAAGTATFAWYLYNAKAHTTKLHMAAGSTAVLQIANKNYSDSYGLSTQLESFEGLLNPVSTNTLLQDTDTGEGNFRKVAGFTNGSENHLVANLFDSAEYQDFYKASLYLRSRGGDADVYISSLNFTDSDEQNPISSAMRLGIVVHEPALDPSESGDAVEDYIFAINTESHIEEQDYNTYDKADTEETTVLDVTSSDTSALVAFTPLTSDAFCEYDEDTGEVTSTEGAQKIISALGTTPVKIDIYLWLEGCDPDCTNDLCSETLQDIAISFAGVPAESADGEA